MSTKVVSSLTRKVYLIDIEKRTVCPECSHNRRKKDEKIVRWDVNDKRGYCHHCNTAYFQHNEKEKIEYIVPKWKNITKLTDEAVKWWNGRNIRQETLNKMKVYSDKEFMPQFKREVEVMCFPYFIEGKLKNIKYRGPKKSFKLHAGSELVLWNLDAIVDEAVFVEGEPDLLSFVEINIDQVVSVPNGAAINLDYLDGCIDKFDKCKKIYIAVDNDSKGLLLRDELVRRLGAERCYLVDFKDCKDANAVLMKHGAEELRRCLDDAKQVPVKGIIYVNSMYGDIKLLWEDGIKPGLRLGDVEMDKHATWETGRLAIVGGIPSHGKTSVVDFIVSKLDALYGWKAGIFTPENFPLKFHYAKLHGLTVGKKFGKQHSPIETFESGYEYIRDHFFYVMDEEDYSIDMILDAAKSLVKNRGIKQLVIDPYNKLDHEYRRGESETSYVSRFLDKLLRFAQHFDVLVWLVAHPRKMNKKKGTHKFDVPTLYDINGSANFYNKADYGFTVYRDLEDEESENPKLSSTTQIHWQKFKFFHMGEQGVSELKFNMNSGRFVGYKGDWDNSDWITDVMPTVEEINEDAMLNNEDSVPDF